MALLCLLDFSATFDSVNHNVLIQLLETTNGLNSALVWIWSYLTDRTVGLDRSTIVHLLQVLSAVACLKARFFGPSFYAADVREVIKSYGL